VNAKEQIKEREAGAFDGAFCVQFYGPMCRAKIFRYFWRSANGDLITPILKRD